MWDHVVPYLTFDCALPQVRAVRAERPEVQIVGSPSERHHELVESTSLDDDGQQGPELEELSRDECLTLLSLHSVGRIAVIADDGLPYVAPVNYELAGETIVFRTNAGTKLDALHRHAVAFQIDSIDPAHRTGWSVLVQGVAHEAAPHELKSVVVEPWIGPKRHLIQVVPRFISGRRIRPSDITFDGRGHL